MTRRKVPRCNDCKQPVAWFFSPYTGRLRPFDPTPVSPHSQSLAYPVEGRRAWKLHELVDDLQARRETSEETARAEAYDMPWHKPHTCPTTPDTRLEDPT